MTTLDDLLAEAGKDNRVCPQPIIWSRLWESLPDRRRVGVGWEPPLPLILAAWSEASDHEKRERFILHLRWACDHGAGDKVAELLFGLTPADWHTEE